jgi:Peptide-N-glycosidase F, C terminal/Secretion system C-terminal sorting domain
MKKIYAILVTGCMLLFNQSNAAIGDTILVQAHQNYVINWYGNYDQWAVFPAAGTSFSKILMKYTYSSPQPGTQWDYTTNVFAKIRTGEYDSTLIQHPYFNVNGNIVDPFYFNTHPVYIYYYNSATQTTDSAYATTVQINQFQNSATPTVVTDSLTVYPGNYYNYIYNTAGVVVDSLFVPADSMWTLQYHNTYNVFEVIDPFELGRVMTPYGSTLTSSWSWNYWFDVTDYAPILHDSVEMRVHYSGYSNGYAFSVAFYMIEGTPPRNVERVRNVYPHKYYEYGITTNPIENYLVPVKFDLNANETNAMLRVVPSGHSFGGAQNCAEFCIKNFKVLVDGIQQFSKPVWRSDCGLNPIWAQNGTWVYDRSNWCPGSKTLYKDQELTPFITAGDSVLLDVNFDSYTYTGGAGFNPGYILSTQLFTYGNPNFTNDATVEEIIKPNADENYSRFNPICNYPIVVIKNTGSAPLTSLTIKYGIKNGTQQYFNWVGSLDFLETIAVTLDSMTWGGSTTNQDNIFEVVVSNPNGVADQYPYNDTLRSRVTFTPVYPSQFRMVFRTNSAGSETTWRVLDENGNVLYSRLTGLSANTLYTDTMNFAPGCYELRINDTGKDGLNFPYNSDGVGYARFVQTNGTSSWIKSFEANFGTSVVHYFTVGFATSINENTDEATFELYPNPTSGRITVAYRVNDNDEVILEIFNLQGQLLKRHVQPGGNLVKFDLDVTDLPSGLYIVQMSTPDQKVVRKLIRE